MMCCQNRTPRTVHVAGPFPLREHSSRIRIIFFFWPARLLICIAIRNESVARPREGSNISDQSSLPLALGICPWSSRPHQVADNLDWVSSIIFAVERPELVHGQSRYRGNRDLFAVNELVIHVNSHSFEFSKVVRCGGVPVTWFRY